MTCQSCKFCYNLEEQRDWKDPIYVCRRYPPPAQLVEIRYDERYGDRNSGRFKTNLPSVEPDWWCGEYQQRGEE